MDSLFWTTKCEKTWTISFWNAIFFPFHHPEWTNMNQLETYRNEQARNKKTLFRDWVWIITLSEQHIEVDSRYRAIQGGTSGCSLCPHRFHRRSRDEHPSLAVIEWLYRAGKPGFSWRWVLSWLCLLLEVSLQGTLTLIVVLLPHCSCVMPHSIPWHHNG